LAAELRETCIDFKDPIFQAWEYHEARGTSFAVSPMLGIRNEWDWASGYIPRWTPRPKARGAWDAALGLALYEDGDAPRLPSDFVAFVRRSLLESGRVHESDSESGFESDSEPFTTGGAGAWSDSESEESESDSE
jgi:hypothetical protein